MTYSDIHFGKIIHLDMPKKEGIIKNLNHQEVPFRFAAVREEVAKGNLVGFQLSPTKNFKPRYEAWNIQRAYLSKDKAFLSKIAQIFPEEDFKPFSS